MIEGAGQTNAWIRQAKRALPSIILLVGALVPTLSLFYARMIIASGASFSRELSIILPLSSFLLAILLWQARFRILVLEAKEVEAFQNVGLDPLSGLPNRQFFDRKLAQAISRSKAEAPIALVAIDIDRFKGVNDAYGHQAGDQLIAGIAGRIKRVIRDSDCLARVGGDEFALLLPSFESAAQCAALAHRIQDAVLAPFDIGSAEVGATLSLGIALGPQDGDSPATLAQAADLALYRAKAEGRNRFAFFDKTMGQKLHLGMTIADDLRVAIHAGQLSVVYQPLIAVRDSRLIGVEALVRWNHPRLGMMSPEEFIPVAESRGLIQPLGEWVLARACQDVRRWPGLRVAVNVSPVQFRQGGFVATVQRIIDGAGIDPGRLDLELTEGVLIQDADQAENVIVELRALGLRMGLDDFGSGYSSMIYLRRFAFDKIKIDRAFLGSVETTGEGAIILESIVSLGHALGLSVTAEGVENEDQVALLQRLGCDEMQGYYFSQPLEADAIDALVSLDAWNARPTDPAESEPLALTKSAA